jgi:hypothetical protein
VLQAHWKSFLAEQILLAFDRKSRPRRSACLPAFVMAEVEALLRRRVMAHDHRFDPLATRLLTQIIDRVADELSLAAGRAARLFEVATGDTFVIRIADQVRPTFALKKCLWATVRTLHVAANSEVKNAGGTVEGLPIARKPYGHVAPILGTAWLILGRATPHTAAIPA